MIGLDPLLAALREAGLPVGIAEMARLHRVFALSTEPDGLRLGGVLRALLVRSPEDRAVFDRVFEAWLHQSDQEVRLREEPEPDLPAGRPPRAPRPRRRRPLWRSLAPLLLPLLSLSLGPHLAVGPRKISPDPPPKGFVAHNGLPSGSETTARTPAEIRRKSFTTWVPTLTATPVAQIWQDWLPLGLGAGALAVACALWVVLRRRSWLPEPAPEPVRKGPPRVVLSLPLFAGPQLLAQREEEALVWGIGHFIAEEPTRRLDLPATVRATARAAGIPYLRFHAARYPREVWLWIDESVTEPALRRVADEVAVALEAHGLPIEQALFRGIPDWLVNATGQAFAPNEVDERRDTALVAVLTDGRVLARHYAADDRRVGLDALLRSLSHWPRLAFVDFSSEQDELGAILARHSIEKIMPLELAGFLGRDETLRRRSAVATDDFAVWAAACALAPSSVDEARAFELRRHLGLATSPWAVRELRAEAPGPPGRLRWKAADRARRINWLRNAESHPPDTLDPGSLLGQALAFWEKVYDQELKERTEGEAGVLWQQTPAHQHLRMERAFLTLWSKGGVAEAVRELYSLHSGTLSQIIEEHLALLAPLDWGEQEHLHLPWTWAMCSGTEQAMLLDMHFGGGMPAVTLRRPGRLWLGLALCLGLAAGALAVAALSGPRRPAGLPEIAHDPRKPAEALWGAQQLPSGSWGVTVATHKILVFQEVPPAAHVEVQWEERRRPCVADLAGGKVEVWSCGTIESPKRLSQAIGRRVIVLADSPGNPDAEALAVDLLDSGSADVVFIGRGWKQSLSSFTAPYLKDQDLLVVARSEWKALTRALRFEGTKPLREVWPGVHVLGDASALLQGSACRNGETLTDQGMVFVRICPGSFRMGSPDSDRQADDDEKPAHEVTLSEYWIGQTEVTEEQYGERRASKLPATNVTWTDAKRFCEQRGWRLPTEAEWEYAARAGTETPWPFAEGALADYAWFGEDFRGQPHPVGTKRPNPWGLYDMHGNVWEWVGDWYEPYEPSLQTDPQGPSDGRFRVLRGGAFNVSPRFLRSAGRVRDEPLIRDWIIGFRCARSPGRQP